MNPFELRLVLWGLTLASLTLLAWGIFLFSKDIRWGVENTFRSQRVALKRKANERRHRRERRRLRRQVWLGKARTALTYSGCVLVVATLAPAVFGLLHMALRGWVGEPYAAGSASMGSAAVAGFATALFVSSLRGTRIELAEKVIGSLAAPAMPDTLLEADPIAFEPYRPLWHGQTSHPNYNIRLGTKNAGEWMVILRQLANPPNGHYTIERLAEQIKELEDWHDTTAKKLKHRKPQPPLPPINWVCITDNTGRFHAVQDYKVFKHQIAVRRNSAYVDLLNLTTEEELWCALQKHMDQARAQTGDGAAVYYPNAIPGLECFWIAKGATREAALRLMLAQKKSAAMLVRDAELGIQAGVITAKKLAEQILFEPLAGTGLDGVALDPTGHAAPPGLPPQPPC